MVTIIFESHATSLDNEADLASGIYDVELSDLGRKQAQELGERYKNENFDAIFCSDLKRSYNTGEIAFNNRELTIIKDKRLREVDYGELTRQPSGTYIQKVRGDFIDKPFPSGQSYQQTTDLMKLFLLELLEKYNDKKVMIIGSRATQYALENLINKLSLKDVVMSPWHWQPGWQYNLMVI